MGALTNKTIKKEPKTGLNWFEISVNSIQRAVGFYNFIFGFNMEPIHLNGYSMASFPQGSGIEGALVMGPGCIPSETGALVYLNGGNDLSGIISKIEQGGGRIVMDKTLISNNAGYFALFIDSEGNKLALHSKK